METESFYGLDASCGEAQLKQMIIRDSENGLYHAPIIANYVNITDWKNKVRNICPGVRNKTAIYDCIYVINFIHTVTCKGLA
jgi:hypothetical protein